MTGVAPTAAGPLNAGLDLARIDAGRPWKVEQLGRTLKRHLVGFTAVLGAAACVASSASTATAAQYKGRVVEKPAAATQAKERLSFRLTKNRRKIKRLSIKSLAGRCRDRGGPAPTGAPRTVFTEPAPIAFPFAWWGAEESGLLRINDPIPVSRKGSFKLTYSAQFLPGDYNDDGAVDGSDFRRLNLHVFGRVLTPRESATAKVLTPREAATGYFRSGVLTPREAATGNIRATVTNRAGRNVCDSYGNRRWKARRVR